MWRIVLLLFVALAGCRHPAYSLVADGPRLILKPPVAPKPEIILKNARRESKPNCDIESGFANVRWIKRTAVIRLRENEFYDPATSAPPGMVLGSDRMYTDSLQEIVDFRSALTRCL